MFDNQMKMETQVQQMCKSAWYHLYNISKIRNFLTLDQTKTVVHAYVTSKLDNNNALLTGIPGCLLMRLQLVQNASAKVVTRQKKSDHVTPLLKSLHWLPVESRIIFKALFLCYKALNGIGPSYIRNLVTITVPKKSGLRSADDHLRLDVPKTRLKTYGDRAFSYFVVCHWNSLPLDIRECPSVKVFKTKLKTHLFTSSFKPKSK